MSEPKHTPGPWIVYTERAEDGTPDIEIIGHIPDGPNTEQGC